MVVPHSYFLKLLPNEIGDDGVNYCEKYIDWHSMQYVDNNKLMKNCTNAKDNCQKIIEKGEYSIGN